MKTDFKLSIPNPCSANWNEMTPHEKGRFCGLCNLTVVDFTQMSEKEIKEYFTCHYGQKTCGRFLASQLAPVESFIPKNRIEVWIDRTEKNLRQSVFKTVFLCLLMTLALFTGCKRTTKGTPHHLMGDIAEPMGEPMFEEKVEKKEPYHLTGDTVYIEKQPAIIPSK